MAKVAGPTTLAVREFLTSLPSEVLTGKVDDVLSAVKADKKIAAQLKKLPVTDQTIISSIAAEKAKRGLLKTRAKKSGGSTVGNGKMTLKRYAELANKVDASTLTLAIQIITQAGGTAAANNLAAQWQEMVAELGEENARKALKFM